MKNRQLYLHYLGLTGVIILGAILRFWHLDLKPLWLDEIITAIFSLGKNYLDVPLDVILPLEKLSDIFTFQSGVSCSQIAENLANYSTHPPLFFCGMYSWLDWLNPLSTDWIVKLRSLPALFGIAAIIAIYCLNSIAFSPTSGIMAALLMAVSPFAVYLSQEARHYTLPMLLIIVSLFLVVKIQKDIFLRHDSQFSTWLLWSIVNIIGLYVHYFFIIALNAEIITLLLLIYRGRDTIINLTKIYLKLFLSITIIFLSCIPWLIAVFSHFQKPETSWLPSPHHIEPIYQTLVNWALMIITLPVENQPLAIQVLCCLLMFVFAFWVGLKVFTHLKLLYANHSTNFSVFTILSFIFFVLLQYLNIAYFLGKDITVVPRYSFVYYPGLCALLAISLEKVKISKYIFLGVGIISCIFVVNNLTFQKPFLPEQVAKNINLEPSLPMMLVVKYDDYQDVAAGLSFAVALEKLRGVEIPNQLNNDNLAFVYKSADLSTLTHSLNLVDKQNIPQFNLWFVGSSMRQRDFKPQLEFNAKTICVLDPNHYHRTGRFPYQLYRCIHR